MHHKSTAKLGTDGVRSKNSVTFTSHLRVYRSGVDQSPMAMQTLPWKSVLPRLVRSLEPELAVPASMQILCKCTADTPRCRMLPT